MDRKKLTLNAQLPVFLAGLAGLFIGVVGMWLFLTSAATTNQPIAAELTSTTSQLSLEESLPVKLTIPAVNLESTFTEPLGTNPDGSVAVPKTYQKVGLYDYGPTPGELGPAVILGHIDSVSGPAIFYNLRKVSLGDEVFITRTDGITAVFTVTDIDDLKQSKFPTKKVYGDLDHAGLRLITCTGIFSQFTQRYSNNLIIYARLTRLENYQTPLLL